jgi:hypothetical protein
MFWLKMTHDRQIPKTQKQAEALAVLIYELQGLIGLANDADLPLIAYLLETALAEAKHDSVGGTDF